MQPQLPSHQGQAACSGGHCNIHCIRLNWVSHSQVRLQAQCFQCVKSRIGIPSKRTLATQRLVDLSQSPCKVGSLASLVVGEIFSPLAGLPKRELISAKVRLSPNWHNMLENSNRTDQVRDPWV